MFLVPNNGGMEGSWRVRWALFEHVPLRASFEVVKMENTNEATKAVTGSRTELDEFRPVDRGGRRSRRDACRQSSVPRLPCAVRLWVRR